MFPDLAITRVIRTAIRGDLKQHCIDPMDVGKFAASILVRDQTAGPLHRNTVPLTAQARQWTRLLRR